MSLRSLTPLWIPFVEVVLVVSFFAAPLGNVAFGAERPNVVLMMSDDQGIGDFGATGNKVFETPHIDRLAKQSGSLTQFYVSPVCSPTRASLMTGRYNYRTRVIDTWLGRSMMEPDEVTIAELLSEAGYATGIFGKWHLGDCYPMRPMDQGFEQSLIHRGGGLAQPSEPRENRRRYTDPILFRNGQQVQTQGYCTDVYFDAAMDFIEESHKANRNFFVYLPTNAPHGPYHDVPELLRRRYQEKDVASLIVGKRPPARKKTEIDRLERIAAMITNIDDNVGRMLKKIDALGLQENTIVIYMVDNGPNTLRYVGPLRGMKTHVHEGGVRSPFWIRWPSRIKPGAKSQRVAAHIDVLPTLLDACGVDKPETLKLDGRSVLPLLTGEPVEWPQRSIVIQTHRGDQPQRYHHFMIRQGRYKLLHASGFGRESFAGAPQFELYDLGEDPGEQNDLAATKPELLNQLKAAYDAWFDDVSSTRANNYAPPRVQIGEAAEPVTTLTRQDWRGGSWAPESSGSWLVTLRRGGPLKLRVEFDAADRDEQLLVKLGSASATVQAPAGSDSAELTLDASAGDQALEAELRGDGRRRGVYQVHVQRSP